MKSYRENITAGQSLILPVGGRTIYIQRSPAGMVLDIEFTRRSKESQKVERVGKGFKATPTDSFDGVKITSSVTQIVDFVITEGDIEIAFDEDLTIIGNEDLFAIPVRTPVGQPLEVLFGGTVAPVLGVVTVDNTNAEAIPTKNQALSTIVNIAPVLAGLAAVALVSDATLKVLRVRNSHASATIAIGGVGVTMANGAVQLEPGDLWVEDNAAGAAWYVISDTAAVNVQMQGLK